MNDFTINNKKQTSHKTTIKEQTQEIFLKRIKELDVKEQELLLKLYSEIIEDSK